MKPISIMDIANAAQVSPTTVTRVINNSGYVSAQKREVVQKAIDELGYIPNKVASGLRTKQTNLIGHVLPVSSENPFFARICTALEASAEKARYNVLTGITQMNPVLEQKMVENLAGLMVEAIVFTAETATDAQTIGWLLSRGIHVVMIERPRQVSDIDVILLDNRSGAALAIEHMIERGHRRIGFIGRDLYGREVEAQRYDGFVQTMNKHGLAVNQKWVSLQPDYWAEYGRSAMRALIASGDLPSALFVASDVMACGVLQILYENRIRIPDDISIIGCDNTLSAQSSPLLTSIDLQQDQIGEIAIEMIIEHKLKQRRGAKMVTLSPVLVDRGSVSRI